MSAPVEHALLSASSASRWLKCTAAPRFEERFPEETTEYAKEGTLAHAICELKVLKHFTDKITSGAFTKRYNKLKKDPLYKDEMDDTSNVYIDFLRTVAMSYNTRPYVATEVHVDFSDYAPEAFGTCDCIMICGDTLHIVDYKHGKGVEVSAVENAQMRLYALGALKRYAPIFGNSIKYVVTTIVQPRITREPSSVLLSLDELYEWGESIKTPAQKAFYGFGEFLAGEHCRFCRGRAVCRARAEYYLALESEKPSVFYPDANADTVSDDEICDLIERGKQIAKWVGDLEAYAKNKILMGGRVPGLKVVSGKSIRTFTNQEAAINAAIEAGYEKSMLYKSEPLSLAQIEKLMGEKEFAEKLGYLVNKPIGIPTLVRDTDKRDPYNSALADFAGVGKTQN